MLLLSRALGVEPGHLTLDQNTNVAETADDTEGQRAAIRTKDAKISKLTAKLAEADRRAGAAERRMADLEDTIFKANRSRDRMKEKAGYETRQVLHEAFWQQRATLGQRDTDKIEAFLRDYLDAPELVLCEVQEHCNQATGFPCWFFAYRKTPAARNL